MAALLAEIELMAAAVFPLGEGHAELDQLPDPRRALLDDAAHDILMAESRARFERISHVQVEGVLARSDAGDATLGVVGVRFGAVFFCNHRDRAPLRDVQGEGQPGDAGAQHDEIVTRMDQPWPKLGTGFSRINNAGELRTPPSNENVPILTCPSIRAPTTVLPASRTH